MKAKTFTKLFLIAISFFGLAMNAYAQNLFSEDPVYYASFESNTVLWYAGVTNNLQISSSTERSLHGLRSAKVYTSDASAYTSSTTGNVSVIIGGTTTDYMPANVANVPAGNYTIKAKVYIENKAPSQILFYWAESTAGIASNPAVFIPLTGVSTGSWQTVQANFTLPALTAMKYSIRLRHMDYAGLQGESTFYIDNLELVSNTTTNVDLNSKFESKVFVNSTTKTLILNAPIGSEVRIINTLGKVMSTYQNLTGLSETSVSSLSSGIYMVEVRSEGKRVVQKINL